LYRVEVTIVDQIATTRVEQVFVNDGLTSVEGTYLFPIPMQAAVDEFNMMVDGQKVEGRIMGRQEARAIYDSIVRQQRDPALLEYVGRDLFQASIFPIPPRGQRTIELAYSQVLPMDGGLIHYHYPLRANPFVGELSGVRFTSPIGQLAISMDIRSTAPLKAIYSPSHDVAVVREGDYAARVGYEENDVIPTADFELFYSVEEGEVGASLVSYKPAGEDGYFLMLMAPQVEVDSDDVVARDILLVLDTSGSMDGPKIAQARDALLYVLGELHPEDRFNIISFGTGVRQFERGPQPVNQLDAARGFLADLQAVGGTDINRALLESLAQVDPERPTVIIFLTDGLPTEGEVDIQRILDNVRKNAADNVQIFAFGVGDDVNTLLLDSISQENAGTSAYVRPDQAIDEVVSAFYGKIATPVLSGLALDFGKVWVEDIYPYPLPDLFAGSQLVLAGRYREGGPARVTLTGIVNGQPKALVFDDLTFKTEGGEPYIGRLWATRKIGYLLNEIRLRGQNREVVDEIVSLAVKYGIATPFTSFFVPEPTHPMAEPFRDQGLGGAVPMPTMTPAPGRVLEVEKRVEAAAEALMEMPQAPASGAGAVQESVARQALRSADTLAATGEGTQGLRHALDKAFAYQAGLWVDTAYRDALPRQELSFGSKAYFDLLSTHPEWAPYLAVSSNLIVVLDGTAYVITDSGQPLMEAREVPTTTADRLRETVHPTPESPAMLATIPATPAAEPTAALQPQPPASQQVPICAAPAFGVALVLGPALLLRRRPRNRA
jgi:Ca-activated chloride channel family protein